MIRERGIGLFDQLHAMLANYRARAKASRICLSPFHIEILRKERRDRIDAVDAHCHYPQFWRGSFLQVLERSEEHTSELQSLMRISYAVFCLKKKMTSNKS